MKGSYRKRGAKIEASVMLKGRRRSRTFDTKRAATQWVAGLVSSFTGEVAAGGTLRDAIERYAREVTEHKSGAREELSKIRTIQRLCPELFDKKLEDLRREDFEHFIDVRLATSRSQNATVNRDLVVLSHTLTMARRWRMMSNSHNPMEHVEKLPTGEPRERRITDEEIDALTAELGYRPEWFSNGAPFTTKKQLTAWAFLFAIETACRRGEILKTTWGDVHTAERYIHLPAHKTKTNSSRNVPLSRKAIEMIEQLPKREKDEPMLDVKPDTLAQTFKKSKNLLGIQNLHFHDTRHEAITRMAQKIPNVLDLARITGHKDLRMLLVYYDRDTTELADFLL
tara:strand:+ start:2739 stop:3758 length:1020 start_codon:yes stop_codon:yes gene_type:complete